MFFDVGFYGNEILVDELRGLRVFIGLGIQPSTRASRRRSAEIQQHRPALFLGRRQRLIYIFAPLHSHLPSLPTYLEIYTYI